MTMTRKYLVDLELAILTAQEDYLIAVGDLQDVCEHNIVLKHQNSSYEDFYVCENCGISCRAKWGSYVHAYGEVSLMTKRAYLVSWGEFVDATPKNAGWVHKTDLNPVQKELERVRNAKCTIDAASANSS